MHLEGPVVPPQGGHAGLAVQTRAADPGGLLRRLEHHLPGSALTHLHTYIRTRRHTNTHTHTQSAVYEIQVIKGRVGSGVTWLTLLSHLQLVAVVGGDHDHAVSGEEHAGVSLQPHGGGRVDPAGLPQLE